MAFVVQGLWRHGMDKKSGFQALVETLFQESGGSGGQEILQGTASEALAVKCVHRFTDEVIAITVVIRLPLANPDKWKCRSKLKRFNRLARRIGIAGAPREPSFHQFP